MCRSWSHSHGWFFFLFKIANKTVKIINPTFLHMLKHDDKYQLIRQDPMTKLLINKKKKYESLINKKKSNIF